MNDWVRFMKKVVQVPCPNPETGVVGLCWQWQGKLCKGYGRIYAQGVIVKAHRYSYEQRIGPIAANMVLDHKCRNRACVNPAHLEQVTNHVNTLRGIGPSAQNAQKTACPAGHDYTPENTYVDPEGKRHCRTCDRARKRAARASA